MKYFRVWKNWMTEDDPDKATIKAGIMSIFIVSPFILWDYFT